MDGSLERPFRCEFHTEKKWVAWVKFQNVNCIENRKYKMKLWFVLWQLKFQMLLNSWFHLFLDPKTEINCRVHCCQTLSSIHIQMNNIHKLAPYFFKIYLSKILSALSRSQSVPSLLVFLPILRKWFVIIIYPYTNQFPCSARIIWRNSKLVIYLYGRNFSVDFKNIKYS